jgi:dipeptidyl-peptidase-4
MHRNLIITCFLVLLFSTIATSGDGPKLLTTAEKSDFTSTSRLSEVVDFINALQKDHPKNIRIEPLTTSTEGRTIPLVFLGNPLPKSPLDLKNDKRAVVYIQANIHAGEVEGKEAIQMLMRDILQKETDDYLANVVLIVCPVFNADGNEKISTNNRTHQNGPVNGVGVRHNGQLLDLNRDAMKLETPEVSAMVSVLNEWDPQVFIDLHTTNGSYRKESPAFTWMMNANTDTSLVRFMREGMMPWVNANLTDKYNTLNCFYGEFEDQRQPEKGWESYASEARYITNYIGLRNRLSILNENYVYADFKTRVLGSYNLLKSILDYVSSNTETVRRMVREADERTVARGAHPAERDSFAVESVNTPTGTPITINTFEVETYKDENGRERIRPTERVTPVTVPYFANWVPKRSVKFPFAYLMHYPDPDVNQLLHKHGIRIERIKETVRLDVQTIKTIELKPTARLNQGHYTDSIKVEYVDEQKEIPAGTLIIRTSQPLGNLVAYLFEPETDDGLLYWNYWDNYLAPQWGGQFLAYPVTKVLSAQEIVSEEIH